MNPIRTVTWFAAIGYALLLGAVTWYQNELPHAAVWLLLAALAAQCAAVVGLLLLPFAMSTRGQIAAAYNWRDWIRALLRSAVRSQRT